MPEYSGQQHVADGPASLLPRRSFDLDSGILDQLVPARFLSPEITIELRGRLCHHDKAFVDGESLEGLGSNGHGGRLIEAIDHLRRQKTIRNREMFPDHIEEPGIDNEAISKMSGDELLRLIRQLPVTTRLVFNLYGIDGFSHREIADMLGISEGTSRWHLSDARRQLKLIIHLMETKT